MVSTWMLIEESWRCIIYLFLTKIHAAYTLQKKSSKGNSVVKREDIKRDRETETGHAAVQQKMKDLFKLQENDN